MKFIRFGEQTYMIFSNTTTPVTASLNPDLGSSIRRIVPERTAEERGIV